MTGKKGTKTEYEGDRERKRGGRGRGGTERDTHVLSVDKTNVGGGGTERGSPVHR